MLRLAPAHGRNVRTGTSRPPLMSRSWSAETSATTRARFAPGLAVKILAGLLGSLTTRDRAHKMQSTQPPRWRAPACRATKLRTAAPARTRHWKLPDSSRACAFQSQQRMRGPKRTRARRQAPSGLLTTVHQATERLRLGFVLASRVLEKAQPSIKSRTSANRYATRRPILRKPGPRPSARMDSRVFGASPVRADVSLGVSRTIRGSRFW